MVTETKDRGMTAETTMDQFLRHRAEAIDEVCDLISAQAAKRTVVYVDIHDVTRRVFDAIDAEPRWSETTGQHTWWAKTLVLREFEHDPDGQMWGGVQVRVYTTEPPEDFAAEEARKRAYLTAGHDIADMKEAKGGDW